MTLHSSNVNKMNAFQHYTIFFCEFFINQQIYIVYKIDCCGFCFRFFNQFQQAGVEKQIQYE